MVWLLAAFATVVIAVLAFVLVRNKRASRDHLNISSDQTVSPVQPGTPMQTSKPAFHRGQVWSYRTRQKEKDSTLLVLEVEDGVVHVQVVGLDFVRHGQAIKTATLPMDQLALSRDVVTLLRTEDENATKFTAAVASWREARDPEEGASMFTVSIAELLDGFEQAR